MEKPGIEPATPGLQDIGLSATPLTVLCTRVGFEKVEFTTWLKIIYQLVIKIDGFKKCRRNYPSNKFRQYIGVTR